MSNWFTTIKKREEKKEFYANEAVLVQFSYNVEDKHNTTKFRFSKLAMEQLGYIPDIPSTNKVTYGFDENNKLVLANIDVENTATSNITSENSFSNKKFLDKLVEEFNIDPVAEHVFDLEIFEKDGIFAGRLNLKGSSLELTYEDIIEEPYKGFDDNVNKEVTPPTVSFDAMVNTLHEESGVGLF